MRSFVSRVPDIIVAPDPILLEDQVMAPLEDSLEIAKQLHEVMAWINAHDRRGCLGLAAPQLGLRGRVFVLNGYASAFIDPEVTKVSGDIYTDVESCLSLPESTVVRIARPTWVKVTFTTESEDVRTLKLHGRTSRAAMHELDHLNGVLITNYLEA